MDQNTIDPIVSIAPAEDKRMRELIREFEGHLAGHTKALKDLGTQSGQKAERKRLKDMIADCTAAIDGFRKKLPPSFIDPDLLAKYLIQRLDSMDSFEADKAKFIAQVTDNPAYAIEWYAGPLAMSQTRHMYFIELRQHLETVSVIDFPGIIQHYIDTVTRDLISKTRLNGSTSTFDRAVELAEQEARADMVGDFNSLNRLLFTVNSFLERMAKTDPIRLEFKAQRAAEQAGEDDANAGDDMEKYADPLAHRGEGFARDGGSDI